MCVCLRKVEDVFLHNTESGIGTDTDEINPRRMTTRL